MCNPSCEGSKDKPKCDFFIDHGNRWDYCTYLQSVCEG